MYATLSTNGADASHKNVTKSQSRILNLYYTNKVRAAPLANPSLAYPMLIDCIQTVLFTVCAMNEIFFIALYLLSFSSPLLSPNLLQQVPGVAAGNEATPKLVQQVFANPYSAGALELARANKMVRPSGPPTAPLNHLTQARWMAANLQRYRTPQCPGSLPASAFPSWHSSRSSTWCSWSRQASAWPSWTGRLATLKDSQRRRRALLNDRSILGWEI